MTRIDHHPVLSDVRNGFISTATGVLILAVLFFIATQAPAEQKKDGNKNSDDRAQSQIPPAATPAESQKYLAEFRETYGLPDDRCLKRMAPPFTRGRLEYYRVHDAHQAELLPKGPDYMWFRWDERPSKPLPVNWGEKHEGRISPAGMGWVGDEGLAIGELIGDFTRLERHQFEGDRQLLDQKVTGDWIFRDGAAPEKILAAMSEILQKECKKRIRFRCFEAERPVIAATGKYVYHPLPGNEDVRDEADVRFDEIEFAARPEKESQSRPVKDWRYDGGAFEDLLLRLSWYCDQRIVNEVADLPDDPILFYWPKRTNEFSYGSPPQVDRAATWKLVSQQTGLTFTEKKQHVLVVVVEQSQ